MADATPLDSNWLRSNSLPAPAHDTDKNARGRVLVIGGSTLVPGGILLTAEASLRAGAGKVQVATVGSITPGIGVAMPEIATIPMGEAGEGDIDIAHFSRLESSLRSSDVIVVGPAMTDAGVAAAIVEKLVRFLSELASKPILVFDAAALMSLSLNQTAVRHYAGPVVLTPHMGELAALLGCEITDIQSAPQEMVRKAAEMFGASVLLKGATSYIVGPGGALFAYAGGGVGLATGGSGDVLAGLAAGLAARSAMPLEALLWAVWLHGEAGRRCAEQIGPLGYLARELLAQIPALMRAV